MSDINLKYITISSNPLIIQGNDVNISSTTSSTDYLTGALHIDGGMAIASNTNSTSYSNGGGLTIRGGTGIGKDLRLGSSLYMENILGIFQINGNTIPRVFVDTIYNSQIKFSPNGSDTRLEIYNDYIYSSATKPATSNSVASLVLDGSIGLNTTIGGTSIKCSGIIDTDTKVFATNIKATSSCSIGNLYADVPNSRVGINTLPTCTLDILNTNSSRFLFSTNTNAPSIEILGSSGSNDTTLKYLTSGFEFSKTNASTSLTFKTVGGLTIIKLSPDGSFINSGDLNLASTNKLSSPNIVSTVITNGTLLNDLISCANSYLTTLTTNTVLVDTLISTNNLSTIINTVGTIRCNGVLYLKAGSNNYSILQDTNASVDGIAINAVSGFRFTANGNDKFKIFNNTCTLASTSVFTDGNVGINTASPSRLLDVNGTFRASGDSTMNSLYMNGTFANNSCFTILNLSGGANIYSNYNTGNLTIRTTDPNVATLYVSGGLHVLENITTASLYSNISTLGNTFMNKLIVSGTSTFGNNILVSTGNVGINTASPARLLEVNGTFRVINEATVGYLNVENGISTGYLKVLNGTVSTSPSTGALQVIGGVGIQNNLNVSGDTILGGNLTVVGSTTNLNSTNTVILDNTLLLNSGPSGSKDSAIIIQRYQVENDSGLGDVVNDSIYFSDTLPLQGSLTTTQIKLSTSASASDNYYVGWWIKVIDGLNNNQVRRITSYIGTSRMATIESAWTTQNPTNGDTLRLYNAPYVSLLHNETSDYFDIGASVYGSTSSSISLTRYYPLRIQALTCYDTVASTSSSSGPNIFHGGISIIEDTDSISTTNGGGITCAGGGAFAKTLRSTNLVVNGVDMTPNTADLLTTQTFNASNNVSSFTDITGLSFSSVYAFDLHLAAIATATTNKYQYFHIRGIKKNSTWQIDDTYVGDDSGIAFSITSSGQIQYTSPNFSGFSSLVFKYKVITI